jgi:hypothetical protein
MKRHNTFKKIDLWIHLDGDKETIVNVDGRNGYTGTYHKHRIPSPSEVSDLERDLLKLGAEIVQGDGRKFIRTGETVGKYDNGTTYRHLRYKVA